MKDRTSVIFGNPIDRKTVAKAEKSKANYLKKYGDDSEKDYRLSFSPIPTLDFLGASNIVLGEGNESFAENGLIVGMTPEAIAEGVIRMMRDEELSEKCIGALREEKIGNSEEINKLYTFLEA